MGCFSAYDIEYGGLFYNLNNEDKTAEVTFGDKPYNNMTAIVIPDAIVFDNTYYKVTSIGDNAFVDCTFLTSLVISKNINNIGRYAFSNNPKLKEIYCFAENNSYIECASFGSTYITKEWQQVSLEAICYDYTHARLVFSLGEYEGKLYLKGIKVHKKELANDETLE